jgi:hypothetical protein
VRLFQLGAALGNTYKVFQNGTASGFSFASMKSLRLELEQ